MEQVQKRAAGTMPFALGLVLAVLLMHSSLVPLSSTGHLGEVAMPAASGPVAAPDRHDQPVFPAHAEHALDLCKANLPLGVTLALGLLALLVASGPLQRTRATRRGRPPFRRPSRKPPDLAALCVLRV